MMKKYSIHTIEIIAGIVLLLTFSSCEDFLDVNKDTDKPSSATPNLLLTPVQGLMSTNCYQQGETTAYFAQQVATLSGFNAVKDRWDYRSVTRIGLFRRHFHDVASNARNLYLTAEEEGSNNYAGAGHTLMVLSTQTATDLFGQMPYREALLGNPSPPYDEQEVIYNGMLDELDLAISLFQASDESDRTMTAREDLLFAGSVSQWESFAHGLKARVLLHLTPNINQDYPLIISEIDLALSNWKDVEFNYFSANNNVWEQNQWGRSQADPPQFDYENNILNISAPTTFLLESVMGYNPTTGEIKDPRMPLMMTPGNVAGFSGPETSPYLSVAPSVGRSELRDDDEYPDLYDSYMTGDYSPQPFMVIEELYFIKAEAAFRLNQVGTAFDAFQSGIAAHMLRVGVAPADISSFLASDMVPNSAGDLTLSAIMMQKWLALYLQAEAWVDMRRYQYSDEIYVGLIRPENLANFWEDNETGKWIQRIPYDNQTEEIFNKPELERLGAFQNPDWLKVPLWWAGTN
ncbi:MAG: SusD/RagB family nutrient-binding outer membrane lipoprotein [Cyclobacteriaceae bacterium]